MEFFRSGFIIIIGFFLNQHAHHVFYMEKVLAIVGICLIINLAIWTCMLILAFIPTMFQLMYIDSLQVYVLLYTMLFEPTYTSWLLYPECSGWHILQLSSGVRFYYKPCYSNCILIMAFIPTTFQSMYSQTHFRYLSYYMPCYLDPHAHLVFYTHNVSVDVHTDLLQVSVLLYALLFRLACSSYLLYSQCFSHWNLRPSSYSIIFL